jgi:prepilin signal peptidase PulO-like enzyme (type II secretory pathway)
MPPVVPIALIAGFICGVLVNLLADYLPNRRHHFLAKASPFVSPSAVPPLPTFIPRKDGRSWPVLYWSGVVAALARQPVFNHPVRHIITEIGLALAFAGIAWLYPTSPNLPFLLFYAAVFAIVIIIDVEHRWIMWITIWPPALVALAEAIFLPRVSLEESLRGGLYGCLILFGLYLLGIGFGQLVRMITGRRVGRTILGTGDIRMATLSGLILGWYALGPALLIMVVTGGLAAVIFIANKVIRTRRYRIFSAIPYGPYIVIGTAFMLYFPWVVGNWIASWMG